MTVPFVDEFPMHCVYLADLAAAVSQHAPAILARSSSVTADSVTDYWVRSRSRLTHWHRLLGECRRAQKQEDWRGLRRWWGDETNVLDEVLVSEITTRVVAALAAEIDVRRGGEELAPVTHATYLTHLEARNRVQQLMIDGRGCSVPSAVRLNRLRQATERWADALIGRMSVSNEVVDKYAVDCTRAAAYREESQGFGSGNRRETAVWLMNASLHDMLTRRTLPTAASARANASIGNSILAMFQPPHFDSFGVVKSLRLSRIEINATREDQAPTDLGGLIPAPVSTPADGQKHDDVVEERWFL